MYTWLPKPPVAFRRGAQATQELGTVVDLSSFPKDTSGDDSLVNACILQELTGTVIYVGWPNRAIDCDAVLDPELGISRFLPGGPDAFRE